MSKKGSQPINQKAVQTKRLIICCDGTGQSSSTGQIQVPTNVTRFAQALDTSRISAAKSETAQIVLYQTGIGADGATRLSKMLAKTFGIGVDEHILEAYTFLANNYEEGDQIYLFGFSRGAFTARAIASLICNAGLLTKETLPYLPMIYNQYKARKNTDQGRKDFNEWMKARHETFKQHDKVVISILGVWDTVGSIGVPETWISSVLGLTWVRNWWNASYGYHDTSLPKLKDHPWRAHIRRAYQALSLEENRTSFEPIPLRFPLTSEEMEVRRDANRFIQCWFPGVHTDVGGGYERAYRDISDISFAWMVDLCSTKLAFLPGLEKRLEERSLVLEDPLAKEKKAETKKEETSWAMSKAHDELRTLAFWLGGSTDRKPGQYYLEKKGENDKGMYWTNEYIHASVRARMLKTKEEGHQWKPPALDSFNLEKGEKGWNWVKEIKTSDGKIQRIALPEWMPGQMNPKDNPKEIPKENQECLMLSPEDLKLLNNDAQCRDIEMVKVDRRRALLGWACGVTITLGAAALLVRSRRLQRKPFFRSM